MGQLEAQVKALQQMLGRMKDNYGEEVRRLEGKSGRSGVTTEQVAERNGFIPPPAEEYEESAEVEEEIEVEVDPLIYKEEPQDYLVPAEDADPQPKKRNPNLLTSCPYCGKNFAKNLRYLREHINIHAGARPFQCPDCPLTFRGIVQLTCHKRRQHGKGFKCLQCGKLFGWKKSLEHHQTLHQEKVETFKCDLCPLEYPSSGALARHVRQDHNPRRPARMAVPKQKRAYRRPVDVNLDQFHNFSIQNHLESVPIRVLSSSSAAPVIRGLKQKRKFTSRPNDRRFGPCPYCGIKLRSKSGFQYHLNSHTGGNRCYCDLCPKSYTTQYALDMHRNTHFIFSCESNSNND